MGTSLSIYENGTKIKSWDGMSGKPKYQSARYQHIPNKGPLPEGTYVARQSEYQERKDADIIRKYYHWRGGAASWGKSRVWLQPSLGTNTFNRTKFTIHGGKEPGSLGCIDLTSHMDEFSKWFKNTGKDLIIHVEYIRH